jgi:hypothetical protein
VISNVDLDAVAKRKEPRTSSSSNVDLDAVAKRKEPRPSSSSQ